MRQLLSSLLLVGLLLMGGLAFASTPGHHVEQNYSPHALTVQTFDNAMVATATVQSEQQLFFYTTAPQAGALAGLATEIGSPRPLFYDSTGLGSLIVLATLPYLIRASHFRHKKASLYFRLCAEGFRLMMKPKAASLYLDRDYTEHPTNSESKARELIAA